VAFLGPDSETKTSDLRFGRLRHAARRAVRKNRRSTHSVSGAAT
jgi:hypothetical protein